MPTCFTTTNHNSIPIIPVTEVTWPQWLAKQSDTLKNWVKAVNFTAQGESMCLVPKPDGVVASVLFGIKKLEDFWSFGALPFLLPPGCYHFTQMKDQNLADRAAMAWGLGAYQFTRYKKPKTNPAQLFLSDDYAKALIENWVESIYGVRDLINTPTEEMGPQQLVQAGVELSQQFHAKCTIITGDDLLKNNFPMIHAVGRASSQPPCLLDLRWGDENAPKLTLVGKGVCFDTGGLDLKSSSNMQLMKKDMGGAAHALGLARMIMGGNLPVRLRVLIPAVENSVAGNAYRPGDILPTRKGITVEIGNTDAEGRLILCDALTEACAEKPKWLIDFATLTGAARVAVGSDIAAFFTEDDELAQQLLNFSKQEQDPLWRLPLYSPYRKMLDSTFADINNATDSSYAGAITAALFLKEFVPSDISWVHFDLMAWNLAPSAGHPQGGEAMALRAVFGYLQNVFSPHPVPLPQ